MGGEGLQGRGINEPARGPRGLARFVVKRRVCVTALEDAANAVARRELVILGSIKWTGAWGLRPGVRSGAGWKVHEVDRSCISFLPGATRMLQVASSLRR